jgi:hypothetical protein
MRDDSCSEGSTSYGNTPAIGGPALAKQGAVVANHMDTMPRGGAVTARTSAARAALGRLLVLGCAALMLRTSLARAEEACPDMFYGAYSIGTKNAADDSLASRLWELREMGANMLVASGGDEDILALLPSGMRAVPGCGLMKQDDWQDPDGKWDEGQARERLKVLADRFAQNAHVYGICLTHEITEYADHARRVWMYKLAKEYFPDKKVMHYYGTIYDQIVPWQKTYGYGMNGEVETDIFFVSLPAASRDGRFDPEKAKRLQVILENAARTPQIPVWGQSSINADQPYVKGPASMIAVWGPRGERMRTWADMIFSAVHHDAQGHDLRLSGFFWRSFGRFPYDLSYPGFSAHRTQVREVGKEFCRTRAGGDKARTATAAPPAPDGHPGPRLDAVPTDVRRVSTVAPGAEL